MIIPKFQIPMNKSRIATSHIKQAFNNVTSLSDKCWDEIDNLLYPKHLDKNEHFSTDGQSSKELAFVNKGILRIYFRDDNGNEWNKHFLQENDFFAASISPDKKSITNIQPLTETDLICISFYELNRLTAKYPELVNFKQNLTFQYLNQKQEREMQLLANEASQNYIEFGNLYPELEKKIPHYHIASFLGISPTQLSRIRNKL